MLQCSNVSCHIVNMHIISLDANWKRSTGMTVYCGVNRDPVSEVLQRLLASQDVAATVTHIHQLCFNDPASFKRVPRQLRFLAGENGGLKAVLSCDE
jgi:hypothetical protein